MVSPARVSKSPSSWRLDIQGMRGLTMLVIVLFHAGLPIPGGFVSLDAFFVISGFVISGMLAREYALTGTISLSRFYLRRFKRLTPALAVTLIIVVLVSPLIVSPIGTQVVTSETALGATYLVANVVVQATTGGYFDLGADLNPLLHTWSLSLEEQFYLIFPTILFLGWLLTRRFSWPRSTAVTLVSLMGAVSLGLAVVPVTWLPTSLQSEALLGYYSPVVRTWEFAAGALVFFTTSRLTKLPTWLGIVLGVLGLALFFIPMWAIDASVRYPGPWTIVPVAGTALLLLAGFASRNPVTRILATRPMVYVGDRSYSWYLWHWPFIVFALTLFPGVPGVALVAAGLSFGAALLSYRTVEDPLRKKAMSNPEIARLTLLLLGASTIAAGSVLVGALQGWWSSPVAEAQKQLEAPHIAAAAGCHTYEPMDVASYEGCWLEDRGASGVMLVGDSNADHFSEAVLAAGRSLGIGVSVTSASDCAFVDTEAPHVNFPLSERCAIYYANTMDWLSRQPPGVVMIATSGAQFSSDSQISSYSMGLKATVTELQDWGHSVLIVQPIPRVPLAASFGLPWDPRGCSMPSFLTNNCGIQWPLEESAASQQPIWDANHSIALETGATLLDLTPDLCDQEICSTNAGDSWVYRDFNHLTPDASERLAENFATAIRKA
ncbi:acyltransferase [bacterium]|nr:acyltransferase [bacterium]